MPEWDQRTRFSKLASILYPGHASQATRDQMAERARNEGKRPPKAGELLEHHTRGAISPLDGRAK
jgi:hypothetical protein